MRSTSRRFLALAIAMITVVGSRIAQAEMPYPYDSGPPTCLSPTIVPLVDSLALPANTPALAFEATKTTLAGTATIEDVVVETPAGASLATTLEPDPAMPGFTLIRIPGPFGIGGGPHSLRWNERCVLSGGYAPTTKPKVRSFYVGPAIEPPFAIGSVYTISTYPQLQIRIVFSIEMKRFGPMASMAYGLYGDPPPPAYGYGVVASESLDVKFDPCIGRTGLVERTFELKAHIAGGTFDPPALATTFYITCPGGTPDSGVVPDAKPPELDAGVDSGSSSEPAAAEPRDETVVGTCLCDVGRCSRTDSVALVPLAFLIVVRRRQGSRRTRRSCAPRR